MHAVARPGYYPANVAGGADFSAPLDPDAGGAGVPYTWDYKLQLGAATISSYTVSADSALTVQSDARGTWTESTTYPRTGAFVDTATGAHAVQVRLTASASAVEGRRYAVTVTATDSDGTPHVRTGWVTVADR